MIDRRTFFGALGGVGAQLVSPRFLSASRACCASSVFVERWSWAMGQPVVLRLFADSETQGYDAAQSAFAELRRVEARLSRFDPGSDLTALNERAGRGPVAVGDDLLAVIRLSDSLRRKSGGVFDPAVEPVMRAWGFHAPRTAGPGARELAEARRAVAAARVVIEEGRVSLLGEGSALDLGGIGVGYGLDRAGAVLRRHGIRAALLDVSGDCLAIGAPPGEPGWLVDIADPVRPGAVTRSIRLRDAALATSANTVSVLRWQGRVVGHVMDPRTAEPAVRVRQVTVTAPSGVLADAWSTAVLVAPVELPPGCRAVVVG